MSISSYLFFCMLQKMQNWLRLVKDTQCSPLGVSSPLFDYHPKI